MTKKQKRRLSKSLNLRRRSVEQHRLHTAWRNIWIKNGILKEEVLNG